MNKMRGTEDGPLERSTKDFGVSVCIYFLALYSVERNHQMIRVWAWG